MRPVIVLISVLCAGAVVAAADTAPFAFPDQPTRAESPRSAPEAQGVSSAAIHAFVEEAEQKIDALHSFMLVRHGQVVAEGWWAPYAADEPHMLYSLSKSFTSSAVGLAVAEGRLTVDDPVLKFFPDEAPPEPSANLKAMRVRDLLTMTAGHHDEDIRQFPYDAEDSVVKRFLALPVAHKPGTFFVYNTPASYMLSAIVQKVTGETVLDYLRPRLFDPLGIANPTWEASRQGVSMGGFGLNVRTEDIARFGQLYLQGGEWQGRQLLPKEWVEAATGRQVSNGSSPSSDWEQGYGYQFWRSRHGFYRGDGAHGQFCLVLPQYDAVIAITAGTRDMGSVMNLVWDRLVPAMRPSSLPADAASHEKLTAKLASLVLPAQAGAVEPAPALVRAVSGRRYVFESNPHALESLTVESTGREGASFTVRTRGTDGRIDAASGAWRKGTLTMVAEDEAIAASGGWTASDTYTLKVVRYRTPYVITYRLRFHGDQLFVESEQNVTLRGERIATFVGRAEERESAGETGNRK